MNFPLNIFDRKPLFLIFISIVKILCCDVLFSDSHRNKPESIFTVVLFVNINIQGQIYFTSTMQMQY